MNQATPNGSEPRFRSDDARWRAVIRKDRAADGAFYFSVRTTGVFCRPSCPARRPLRENVRFHATIKEAQRSGFRACKRCSPDGASLAQRHAAAVAQACRLIEQSSVTLDLSKLSQSVGLSPSHFHRLFKAHTGLTPNAYATARRHDRVRGTLRRGNTITAAAYEAGFNSSGRFYAASAKALGMPPKAFCSGGSGAEIKFAVGQCTLGLILVAASNRGVCAISLGDDEPKLVEELHACFPKARFRQGNKAFRKWVSEVIRFVERPELSLNLPLDLQGTLLQRRVWQALAKIPAGKTATYTQIARRVGRPKAVRAVAQAIAANKIALAVPCHRVIRSDGSLCGYRWGVKRKAALLAREREQFASGKPLR